MYPPGLWAADFSQVFKATVYKGTISVDVLKENVAQAVLPAATARTP